MNVQILTPALGGDASNVLDAPIQANPVTPANDLGAFSHALSGAFNDASTALGRADAAESAFSAGKGGMQEMVLERAQADVALSIASAAASRVAASLTTILGMQI